VKLAVSNLAWGPERQAEAFALLAGLGVDGVEVAPTRIADWEAITPALLAGFRAELTAAGLRASSLQAIFYGCPEAQLLGDAAGFARMRTQIARVAEIGFALGARVAVFGAPRNRGKGGLPDGEAAALGAERLRVLGEIVAPAGLTLGMEPVPGHYGGDFLTRAGETLAMVRAVDHPGIGLHLDSGCVLLGGDAIGAAIAEGAAALVHMHMAEPDLAGFAAPVADHAGAGRALREIGYDRWLAIEMREVPGAALAEVATAVAVARAAYFGSDRPG
jgi:sugar phosphate isomerase/epimerase